LLHIEAREWLEWPLSIVTDFTRAVDLACPETGRGAVREHRRCDEWAKR